MIFWQKKVRVASGNLVVDCKCLIFDERSRVLLVKEPEHWETPGGRLKAGETPAECLVREIGEELGAEAEIMDKLPIFIRKKTKRGRRNIDVLVIYFFGRLISRPKLSKQKNNEEILEIGWFDSNDIQDIPLNKAEKAQLYHILKNLKAR